MRASDADRAQVAEQLRRATIEGRLLGDEFDERLEQALDARTYGELDAIVADLPHQHEVVRPRGRAGAGLRRCPRPFAGAAGAVGRVGAVLVIARARLRKPPPRAAASGHSSVVVR
jgi:hypothetical protein